MEETFFNLYGFELDTLKKLPLMRDGKVKYEDEKNLIRYVYSLFSHHWEAIYNGRYLSPEEIKNKSYKRITMDGDTLPTRYELLYLLYGVNFEETVSSEPSRSGKVYYHKEKDIACVNLTLGKGIGSWRVYRGGINGELVEPDSKRVKEYDELREKLKKKDGRIRR